VRISLVSCRPLPSARGSVALDLACKKWTIREYALLRVGSYATELLEVAVIWSIGGTVVWTSASGILVVFESVWTDGNGYVDIAITQGLDVGTAVVVKDHRGVSARDAYDTADKAEFFGVKISDRQGNRGRDLSGSSSRKEECRNKEKHGCGEGEVRCRRRFYPAPDLCTASSYNKHDSCLHLPCRITLRMYCYCCALSDIITSAEYAPSNLLRLSRCLIWHGAGCKQLHRA
jgi:hypothetical protein